MLSFGRFRLVLCDYLRFSFIIPGQFLRLFAHGRGKRQYALADGTVDSILIHCDGIRRRTDFLKRA